MATATLTIDLGTVSAAHQLPNHDGKCRNLHGHDYRIEVTLHGRVARKDGTPTEGMVVDFGHVKQYWKENLEPFIDHRFLNEVLDDEHQPPTAENLALWLLPRLTFSGYPVVAVTVWETPTSRVQVTVDDLV